MRAVAVPLLVFTLPVQVRVRVPVQHLHLNFGVLVPNCALAPQDVLGLVPEQAVEGLESPPGWY